MPRHFRFGIHEEWQFADHTVLRQLHITRVVECNPVHLPRAEQFVTQRRDARVSDRQCFIQGELPHVCGVHRDPAKAGKVELGPAMLCCRDVSSLPECLVARGFIDANAIVIPRGDTCGACESHEEFIQVGTFAAQIATFKHGFDIPPSAPARGRIAVGVIDDPVVYGLRLLQGGLSICVLYDGERSLAYDTVEWNMLRRVQIPFHVRWNRKSGLLLVSIQIDGAVGRLDHAAYSYGTWPPMTPFGVKHG